LKAALIKTVRRSVARWPRFAFALARPLAWLLRPLGRGVSEESLAALFPELSRGRLEAARRRSWSNFLQAEALTASVKRIREGKLHPEIVSNRDLADVRPPLILASFHIGLYPAVGEVLRRLTGDVLVVHRGGLAPRPGVTLVPTGETEWERARAFHRAVAGLRSGAFVYTTLDGGFREGGYDAPSVEAPMLGGTISLARGGFALARISGTQILPVVARRAGRTVVIVCGDPIPPGPEEAMAAAAAAWLGHYLREFPGEISLRTLEVLRPPPGR
jgi:hypothetical protein